MARDKRWVVGPRDGGRLGDVLARMGEGAGAISEGRVFVGRRRASSVDDPVRDGDEVRVGTAQVSAARVEILFAKDGLVGSIKPAGIPTVPDHAGGAHSLVALVARAIGVASSVLRVTSRLDREVSGVVIFALNQEAEDRLKRARVEGLYRRRYLAIADTRSKAIDDEGIWATPIGRGRDARHRAALGPDAKEAETHFRTVACIDRAALVAVEPITGRTHQIRVHASHAGVPLLGDRDYGGEARFALANGRIIAVERIALHAAKVTVPDRWGAPLSAEAPVPPELGRVWSELGGAVEAWNTAVSCDVP